MKPVCQTLPHDAVRLTGSLFFDRARLNRQYVASLTVENLLQNFYLEAGLRGWTLHNSTHQQGTGERHWGWESPTCQLRGHFLGHWLSAAAQIAAAGDAELRVKAETVVAELAACQRKHGGEWASAIPEQYMHWLAAGTPTWAPHYIHHKTFMGLVDAHRYLGSQAALEIADRFADWFWRWSGGFTRAQLDDILDCETGGMLEAWADLYGATGAAKYLDLIERYTRGRLFEPLLAGRDVLTNFHANTTIPEAHGAARAYEVTGDERWRAIVEAYWRWAVTERGTFVTGGQTSGEIWTPPFAFAARRGDKNQEHCVVYNMIRLADYLLRWTGDATYADYIERNLYGGILAQQHPGTGMISYFLPLEAGAHKRWGHPTNDFWCCHGSLVQAHAMHQALVGYQDTDGLCLAQYIPSELRATVAGTAVTVSQGFVARTGRIDEGEPWPGAVSRPNAWSLRVTVRAAQPTPFALKLRLPQWLAGEARLWVDGQPTPLGASAGEFACLARTWHDDTLLLELPKALRPEPLPDEPGTVAWLDGPVPLAGLCDHEPTLVGDPATMLVPDNEREWGNWLRGWRTVGQARNIRFRPLHEITDEAYTLYFPVRG
jgi:DUF1680 family protein